MQVAYCTPVGGSTPRQVSSSPMQRVQGVYAGTQHRGRNLTSNKRPGRERAQRNPCSDRQHAMTNAARLRPSKSKEGPLEVPAVCRGRVRTRATTRRRSRRRPAREADQGLPPGRDNQDRQERLEEAQAARRPTRQVRGARARADRGADGRADPDGHADRDRHPDTGRGRGTPRTPGPPGRDGLDGLDGLPGRNGLDGFDGRDGERGPRGPAATVCRSERDATWLLVVRNSVRVTNLRASFEGVRAPVRRLRVAGRVAYRVSIDASGLQRGVYVARVRYRIARTTGSTAGQFRNNTRVQYWRVCFGNPKDGLKEGLNRLTTTIL